MAVLRVDIDAEVEQRQTSVEVVKVAASEQITIVKQAIIAEQKVRPHHLSLQSTTPPSLKYHATLFKVPHHPLYSTTSLFLKYHTTVFKVPHNPL